jgi:hypothetical protein
MATIRLSDARELCTDAEFRLVESASRKQIGTHSAAQLKRKVDQARKLRDKWQDLATQQRRETQQQQGARVTDKNARSRKKSELFAEVLSRFEEQLKKADASAGAGGAGSKTAAKPSKRKRAEQHRATRSQTKKQLDEQRSTLGASAASPNKKTVKKKSLKKGG